MAYTANWVQPVYGAKWPAPPKGQLGIVHLLGDPQNDWTEIWPDLSPGTVVDQITRDIDMNVLAGMPDAAFQVGDAVGGANTSLTEHQADIAACQAWLDTLGYPKVWPVVGNHDTPGSTLDGPNWAALWGVSSPRYTVDLGGVNAVVLGWDSNNIAAARHATPVGPYTEADLAWLDAVLTDDTRPTVVVNHAHLRGMATGGDSTQTNWDWWEWNQSTIDAGGVIDVDADALKVILHNHTHVIAWLHGHTHSWWWGYDEHPNSTGKPGPHTDLFSLGVGRRSIARVDAAAIFEFKTGNPRFQNPAASPYVTILDDGRTIETRWRQHDWHLWAGVPGQGRVQTVTAT